MFFKESEKLANSSPGFRDLVARCDKALSILDGSARILAAVWAHSLGDETKRVEQVLSWYTDQHLLTRIGVLECACGTANDTSQLTCTACSDQLTRAVPCNVYKFSDPQRALVNSFVSTPSPSNAPIATTPDQPAPRFGIITALPYEFAAMKVMLDDPRDFSHPGKGAGRRYCIGSIPSLTGNAHQIALALLVDTGNNQAAARAAQLLNHFPAVESVIMCGIAGGIPCLGSVEADVRLGDVVVSDRGGVVQYDFGKEEATKWTLRSAPRPPSASLLEAVKHLVAAESERRYPWETYLSRTTQVDGALRPADNHSAKGVPMEYPPDSARRERLPRVFLGPIASSNTLLKNEGKRDMLAEQHGVRAVEMEGSGVADATWTQESGYLVVRGIVDYCDSNKGDHWHKYSAVAAAAYVRAVIESLAV